MASAERLDAFSLMKHFRPDEAALGDALALFIDRPDYGFVWLAYDDGIPAGCVSVAFGISTEAGGVVAELSDLWVAPDRRRRGIGSAMLITLQARLSQLGATAFEASIPGDPALLGFFAARGYAEQPEVRVSLRRS